LSTYHGRRRRYILCVSLVVVGLALALLVFGVPHFGNPKTVAPRPSDFQLLLTPSSLSLRQGTIANSTISVSSVSNFAGIVSLSVSVSPNGLGTSFSVIRLILSSGVTTTSKLMISVPQTLSAGSYSVSVAGTNGSITHSASLRVTVTAPLTQDFELSSDPSSLSILQGTNANTTLSVSSLNNFAGTVDLATSISPSGLDTSLGTGAATVPPGGTSSSRVTISAPQTTSPGSYNVTLIGTSGSLTRFTIVSVFVTTPEIRISYSWSYNSTLQPSGVYPPVGDTFLVVHLTVENIGYRNFSASPIRDMYIVAGGNSYNVSAPCYVFVSCFQTSNLNNAQGTTGEVVFEVPQASTSFKPWWRLLAGEQIRFDWVPIS